MVKYILHISLLAGLSVNAFAQQPVNRKDLLSAVLPNVTVGNVQVKEVTLAAGQRAPLHRHPCPVVGYVAEGTIIYQLKDQPVQTLHVGDAFYEPADATVVRFDNASPDHPARFVAFYLRKGEEGLVEVLGK